MKKYTDLMKSRNVGENAVTDDGRIDPSVYFLFPTLAILCTILYIGAAVIN